VDGHLEHLCHRRLNASLSLDVLARRRVSRFQLAQLFLGLPEGDHKGFPVVAVDKA
jgi:hypothetical protein